MKRRLICIAVIAVATLTGCASGVSQKARILSSDELLSFGSNSLIERVAAQDKKVPSDIILKQYECDGPFAIEYQIYPLTTADGKDGSGVGELNSIWYIESPEGLYKVDTPDEISIKPEDVRSKNLLQSAQFVVEPGMKGVVKVHIRVYERDKIGKDTVAEINNFVSSLGNVASNIYPNQSSKIPVLSDIGELIIAIPNIFLKNDNLGEFTHLINRYEDSVVFWGGKAQKGNVVFNVDIKPLYVPKGKKVKCGLVEEKKETKDK